MANPISMFSEKKDRKIAANNAVSSPSPVAGKKQIDLLLPLIDPKLAAVLAVLTANAENKSAKEYHEKMAVLESSAKNTARLFSTPTPKPTSRANNVIEVKFGK